MDELEKLFNVLTRDGYYTKSFEEFQSQYNDPAYRDKVFGVVSRDDLFTKSREEFDVKYSPSGVVAEETISEDPLKKKEDTVSVSEDGSLESQKPTDFLDFTQMASSPMLQEAQREEILQQQEQGIESSQSPDFIRSQIDNLNNQLEDTLEADVPPPTTEREIMYDRFGGVVYDSSIGDELQRTAKRMRNAKDAAPIQEEIQDLQLKLDGAKLGFGTQPSFKEVYQEAYNPETKTLDKQKLIEMGVQIPLLLNDNSAFLKMISQSKMDESVINLYNELVEDYYNDKKKNAGYVYLNGEFVDPSQPMPGYGFDAAIDAVNFNTIVGAEEEEAVGKLNNMFKQYGFRFEQPDDLTDNLIVFGPDGKQLSFFGEEDLPLDNWTDATDKKYGSELRRVLANAYSAAELSEEKMLEQAMVKPSDPSKAIKNEVISGIVVEGASWQKQAVKRIDKDAETLNTLNALRNSQKILINQATKKAEDLKNSQMVDGLWKSYEAEAEYNDLIKERNDIAEVYEATYKAALKKDANLKSDVSQMQKYEGDRAMMMADMWDLNNVPALLAQSFGEGAGSVVSGAYGLADLAFSNFVNLTLGYDETAPGYQTDEMQRERKANVSEGLRKGLSSLTTLDFLPGVDAKTSEETIAGIKSKPFLSAGGTLGIFMGISESIPALLSGYAGVSPVASFAALQMDGLAREMDNIPEFANISENEKFLILAPIATVSGVLENFGYRNVLSKSSLVGRLTVDALKKFGAQTAKEGTKRTFKEIIERSVMNKIAKGAILSGAGTLAEMETEAAQQFSETWMKEIYDLVKGDDFYKQSIDISKGEFFNMEFAKEIAKAAYAGAIGGAVIGAPSAYSSAVKNNTLPEISDAAFNLFTMTTTPESVERTLAVQRAAYNAKVGIEINPETGQKYTQKEVDDTLLQYEYLIGQKNEINPNWDAKSQKQVLALLMQKKNIEQSIEGLNKDTTKDQQRQIEILEEDIEVISSAANKNAEEVVKKEYAKAKQEGFTGTIEAFKFRESVEKAAKEKQAPVTEDVVEEATVTEEAPVAEEQREVPQEALETQPITKITTELVAKEKKGELTQEETDGVLLGIMEKIEAENAKRKSPLSPEQAQKKLGKMQQRVFEANKDRYLELSGVMPATQEQVVEEAPVVEQVTEEVVEEAPVVESNVLTQDIYNEFVNTGQVPAPIVNAIAQKVKQAEPLNEMEQAVSVEFAPDIEAILIEDSATEAVVEETPVVEQITEEVVQETPVKKAPKRKTRKKKDVSLQQDEIQDKRRTTRRAKRKSDRTRKSSPIDIKGKPRYDVGRSDRVVGDDTVVQGISLSEKEAQDLEKRLGEKAVLDTEFYETNDAKLFHKSITESTKNNKYAASVFVYPVSDYKNSRLFLTADGKAGLAITEDGDIISVFSYGEGKGRVPQLIVTAIKEGAVSLDHYDTVLTKYYADFGFVPAAKVTWNDEFAPAGWSKETFKKFNNGEPDVVAMVYDGGNRETITERVGTFEDVTPKLEEAPYVTEWDDAKKLQAKKKKPKKQEAKISEEVQKEIDRAERLRDRIVADKTNRLSRTKGFEQKEDLRDEIRQDERKYNNIITELKEGKRTKFQVKETQETKTDTSRYQQFVSVLKRSFPSVEVVTTQAEFDTLLKETGANELITKDQSVYGAVYQGKLYLNPSLENYNTPIHEFGHVWMNVAKEANPKLYEKGIGLVKGSEYEQQVKNNPAYKDSTEQEILEEALATAIGDKGEAFVKESKRKSFKDWLSTLYGFVRKLTGISKYTAKQLEDITLDEFTQAVAVDLLSGRQLFEGAEITDMGDALQLMAEKGVDLDAAMTEAINDMIDKGFKAAEIKGVLLQMGYKARAINDALVVNIDADIKLPNEFANIDGGVREGEALFRSVMQKLKEFAAPKLVKRSIKEQYNEAKKDGYEGTLKEYTEEQNIKKVEMLKQANPALFVLTNEEILKKYPNIQNEVVEKQQKSRAEIRAKAIELLEAEDLFQAQDNLTQLKLIESMDRTMKTRSNKEVQKRISAIKQTLKGVREGVKDLQAAKTRIKKLIREELLPIGVTTAEANKLIRTIEKATKETYESSVAEVMQVVDRQISRKRKSLLNDMLKLAKQKSKGKKGAARTSPEAARFFEQAKIILTALSKNDTNKLETIEEELRKKEASINEIIDKINDGVKVTPEQQEIVALAQAFDILGSLNKQDLSETEDALNLMKSELESGMESLRTRRAARKAIYDKLREEANESIKAGYEFLFDEDGKPLTDAELKNRESEIFSQVRGIKSLVKAVNEYYTIAKKPKTNFFAEYLKHLGTLTNGLDRKGDFFKKNIYDKLNNMEESYLQGYFNTIDLLSSELESIGIEGGYDGLSKIINDGLIRNQNKIIKGIKLDLKGKAKDLSISKAEAMRIYSLSKNAEQRARLKEQGFTDAKMKEIEAFLGEQLVQAADKVVDILSTSYYESVNKVYEEVNDVSLPYIKNYFPTRKARSLTSKTEREQLKSDINSGNFAGAFSAQQASALKERKSDEAIEIKGQDFSSVLEDHIRSMERFKAYAMGTKEINIIINHTDSVGAVLEATNLKSTISNGIMYAINPSAMQDYFELKNKWFTNLQRKFVGVTLALKFIQLPKQASSFVNAFADYKLRQNNRIPGVDFALDALGFTLDTAYTLVTFRSTFREAMKSASFRNRIRESFKTADLLGLETGVGTRSRVRKTRLGRALRTAKVVANSPTLVGDVLGVMGYMSAQRANLRNGMSEQEAIEKFNAYNETQQTRRPTEKVGIQRSNSIFARSFTMFGSTLYLQLNKIMQSATNITRDGANSLNLIGKGEFNNAYKQSPKTKDYRELFLNLSIANFLFVAIANAFKYNPFMDDDDEITDEEMERIKKAKNALKRGKEISDEDQELIDRYQFQLDKNSVIKQYSEALRGLNILYNLPLIGPSSKMVVDYAVWDDPNAFSSNRVRQINPLTQLVKDVGRDIVWNDKGGAESIINPLISFAMGIPVKKPLALVDRIQSIFGDDEMYREGFEELNDDGERKFKGTFEEYKAKQMEENMYELLGISYSYRPGSGKDWTKKKMTITVEPKAEKEEEQVSSGPRRRKPSTRRRRPSTRKNR